MKKEQCKESENAWYPGKEYQPLFDHMYDEYGLILLHSELDDIINVCKQLDKNEGNGNQL